jgi:hypothetical protein
MADFNFISFPATQVASADPNSLDDYEEGTWVPVLAFGGASVGITYSTQAGRYTKIGNRTTFVAVVNLTSKGSSVGAATVSVPFAATQIASVAIRVAALGASGTGFIQGYLSGSTVVLEKMAAGVATALSDTDYGATTAMVISGTYES